MTVDLTVGVEEEFFLVDDEGQLAQEAEETLAGAPEPTADGAGIQPELLRCQVESATEVCRGVTELLDELRSLRGRLASGAAERGARLLATSTAVSAAREQSIISPDPRYLRMAEHFGALVYTGTTCGCHVHVGIDDREAALRAGNHLRLWLPVLLALSANSPFNNGHATGYASSRYLLWSRWPTAGPPPYLESVDHYESIVRAMLRTEAVLDRKMIYWDIRPSEQYPTLELRVCDVAGTAEEAALYGILVRALVRMALEADRPAPRIPHEVLRAGLWVATREGLEGRCPDPDDWELRPVREILDRLRDRLTPALRETDELSFVDDTLAWLREHGGGAARQRAAYAQRRRLADVIDMLAEQTLRGIRRPIGSG
ncbi:MAG TPA: glutamate--cysteine ligase [Actinophytocola sp.]|uniref:carboxylate-amine ligase n=1 Tax=Actinophytocola sp. TaxID=1872138 RepID=UPI002DDCCA48|nr:glutamate--cysteine ligase [Actinophytocola sp.]HEV2781824.1 glutamate--cysteine ligase [Actinophytocola sp.]